MKIIDENCLENFCMCIQDVLYELMQIFAHYPLDFYDDIDKADAIELEEIKIQNEISSRIKEDTNLQEYIDNNNLFLNCKDETDVLINVYNREREREYEFM